MKRLLLIVIFISVCASAMAQNIVLYKNEGHQNQRQKPDEYRYTLRPSNVVIGTSLIGLSLPAYIITNSTLGNRMTRVQENHDEKLKSIQDQYSLDVLSQMEYNGIVKTMTEELAAKLKNIENSQRVINYVCAGTSVVGVIIVLTGLKKETQNGIQIADNLYYNGGGLTWLF